ncbi:MAG: tetratricopeptide repeat protein [Candidatus Krumholzibacteriia bacterium]
MKRTWLIFLIVGSVLVPGRVHAGDSRDLTRRQAASVIERVLHGRADLAIAYLDSLRSDHDRYPLYHIMRARCLQEYIPMDDANTAYAKQMAEPALGELDRAIEICTARIDSGGAESKYYLYRGWAWMSKSYIRSMSRSFWTAGREAGRGKKDLKIYLAAYPDDTTANGIMGAFLYFADTIPKAFKFFSKLLRLPSGDRLEGLDRLRHAALNGDSLDADYRLVLYNVYFYFEGRYEEGLAGLRQMVQRYPEYSRTSIALSVARAFVPRQAAGLDRLVGSNIRRISDLSPGGADANGLEVVRASRAWGSRYCDPAYTITWFEDILRRGPLHPDWVRGFARYELGSLYAWRGRKDDARSLLESVVQDPAHHYYRSQANRMLEDLEEFAARFEDPIRQPDGRWIEAVYRSGADSLAVLAERFDELAPASLAASFYLGDCHLLAGDHDGALVHYRRVLEADAPAWEETYQMLAGTRMAEVFAARKEYGKASGYMRKAQSFYHKEYLIDWVIEGRKRYFDRLDDGKESVVPTQLSINP